MMVITGDEILAVTYADGTEEIFDSSTDRLVDFYDGTYDVKKGGELLVSESWFTLDDSYERMYG